MNVKEIPEYWTPAILEDICRFARIGGMNIYSKDLPNGLSLCNSLLDDYASEGMRILLEESMSKK